MSKLSDYARALLLGGLPTVLDGMAGSQGDMRTETTAPTGSRLQYDAAKPQVGQALQINGQSIMLAVGGLLAVGLTIALVIKAAR